MSKVLTAYGTNGKVAIHEPSANLDDPISNLSNIYFHSDLDYLSITKIVNGILSLPIRYASYSESSSAYGSTVYSIYQHSLGYTPLIVGVRQDSKQPIVGDTLIQQGGACNLRSILIGSDNNYLYIRELYLNKDRTFSSIDIPYTIYIFNEAIGI